MIRISAEKLKESFDRHGASPQISIEEYVRSRQIALAQRVLATQRVYLDKNIWILVRDAAMERPCPIAADRLLEALNQRVGHGEIVCPISESLFMELMKQSDVETHRATAKLMDERSRGPNRSQ